MAAKGLTRKITHDEALSYKKTVPNRRGVTALAEINGDGAYARRNERMSYTPRQKAAMKRMSPKRREAFKRMLGKAPKLTQARANGTKKGQTRKSARRAFEKNGTKKGQTRKTARRAFEKNRSDYRPFGAPQLIWGSGKLKKADYITMMVARGHSKKQAESYWKRKGLRPGEKKKPRKRRTYGKGTIKPLRASYGGKSRYTYKYKTKKGHVRDIPDWALLGYRSAREMREVERGQDEAARGRLSAKKRRLMERRERAAARTEKQILAGRGVFAPNHGEETVLSFEEWKDMRTNAARKTRKRKTTTKKRARKGTFAAFKARMKRKHGKKVSEKQIKNWYNFGKAGAKGSRKPAARRAASKATKGKGRKKKTTAKRRTTKRRTTRRARPRSMTVTLRANGTKRGQRRKTARRAYMKKNGTKRGMVRKTARRAYRKNVPMAEWKGEMIRALKLGLLVTGGFMAQRAFAKVLDEHAFSKIKALQTGTASKWRGIISGAVSAAVLVPASTRVFSKESTAIAAGVAASFIHGAIITALKSDPSNKTMNDAASYLGAYTNAEGSNLPNYLQGTGSYYEFTPHEIFPATSGVGEYYELPVAGMGEYYELPVAGFGQEPAPLHLNQLTQAAAGYGQATGPQGNPLVTQAAAGMGMQPLHLNQLTQAAAGYGNNSMDGGSPLVTQAAAGTGQFMAYGAHGVGEYDEVGTSVQPMTMDEGVHPNLHSAEQALSVAEAAAGVGSLDVPLQSTVNPTVIADPIQELPGGSRSGVFQGGDGIFG
ncbi:MAG: hypothetical protein GY772_06745 [bacterium]|nr:hypothetical protein [bacterium]